MSKTYFKGQRSYMRMEEGMSHLYDTKRNGSHSSLSIVETVVSGYRLYQMGFFQDFWTEIPMMCDAANCVLISSGDELKGIVYRGKLYDDEGSYIGFEGGTENPPSSFLEEPCGGRTEK